MHSSLPEPPGGGAPATPAGARRRSTATWAGASARIARRAGGADTAGIAPVDDRRTLSTLSDQEAVTLEAASAVEVDVLLDAPRPRRDAKARAVRRRGASFEALAARQPHRSEPHAGRRGARWQAAVSASFTSLYRQDALRCASARSAAPALSAPADRQNWPWSRLLGERAAEIAGEASPLDFGPSRGSRPSPRLLRLRLSSGPRRRDTFREAAHQFLEAAPAPILEHLPGSRPTHGESRGDRLLAMRRARRCTERREALSPPRRRAQILRSRPSPRAGASVTNTSDLFTTVIEGPQHLLRAVRGANCAGPTSIAQRALCSASRWRRTRDPAHLPSKLTPDTPVGSSLMRRGELPAGRESPPPRPLLAGLRTA